MLNLTIEDMRIFVNNTGAFLTLLEERKLNPHAKDCFIIATLYQDKAMHVDLDEDRCYRLKRMATWGL